LHSDAKQLHCDTKAAGAEERIDKVQLRQHSPIVQKCSNCTEMHQNATIAPRCTNAMQH